jgi:putative DNA methylase
VERDLVAWRVISKKGSDVALLRPVNRRVRGKVDAEADHFETWLDAVHTALLLYDEDGAAACETFLKRTGLLADGTFKACLQAMINAVPRTKSKGRFVRPEAELLERLRAGFFEEVEAPAEEETPGRVEQMPLI